MVKEKVGVAPVEGGGQSLVGSLEYNTAVELELWKVSQQEAFEVRTRLNSLYDGHFGSSSFVLC